MPTFKRVALRSALPAAVFFSAIELVALDQGLASPTSHHGVHSHAAETPREGGQDAFAAIAEIVTLLRADPSTDWSRVDIDALREHLRDMNLVMLETQAQATVQPGAVRFEVRGQGEGAAEAAAALRRMVPAHAPFLAEDLGLPVEAEPMEGGVALMVKSDDADTQTQIKALGFYGLMAIGGHHQRHHLAMARGEAHAH